MSEACLACGACCAHFRVAFYWAEADDAPGGTVPHTLTVSLGGLRRAMLGTAGPQPRCAALEGTVGTGVRCAIYDKRPGVCREFEPAGTQGRLNPHCDRARAAWGLPPLAPGGQAPDFTPRAA